MNIIERWFNRHDVSSTKRKMKEWETDNVYEMFKEVFGRELTRDEKDEVMFYLLNEDKIQKNEEYEYI
jgi:hypothetical protein